MSNKIVQNLLNLLYKLLLIVLFDRQGGQLVLHAPTILLVDLFVLTAYGVRYQLHVV